MFDECLAEYGGIEPVEWLKAQRIAECGEFECCECKEFIQEGDNYELVVANYEGDWKVYVTCVLCVRIRESLFKGDYVFGRMWQAIEDHYGLTKDGLLCT
jgi:hypothetical protein